MKIAKPFLLFSSIPKKAFQRGFMEYNLFSTSLKPVFDFIQ